MVEVNADGSYVFDLSNTPVKNRQRNWNDRVNEFFYNFEITLTEGFDVGRFHGRHVGGLSVAHMESDAMNVQRTASHISSDPQDSYFLLLPRRNRLLLTQRGGEAEVGPGQFSLVSANDPYGYVQNSTDKFNNLIIPGNLARNYSKNIADYVARPSRSDPTTRMFVDFANAFCDDLDKIDASSQLVMSRIVVDLFGLVVDGVDHLSRSSSVRIAHLRRIDQLVDREFRNHSFGVDRIASVLRLSRRYIQELFASRQQTVSDAIRTRRVEEARRILTNPGSCHLKVSEAAYSVGFVSLAHFSRVFKDETGVTPSEFRGKPVDR